MMGGNMNPTERFTKHQSNYIKEKVLPNAQNATKLEKKISKIATH